MNLKTSLLLTQIPCGILSDSYILKNSFQRFYLRIVLLTYIKNNQRHVPFNSQVHFQQNVFQKLDLFMRSIILELLFNSIKFLSWLQFYLEIVVCKFMSTKVVWILAAALAAFCLILWLGSAFDQRSKSRTKFLKPKQVFYAASWSEKLKH